MSHIAEALRQQVIERAHGCCEYCRIDQDDVLLPHEIDHIIAEKHRGQTVAANLCLSCIYCNRNKGSDISSIDLETMQLARLFNPRTDIWSEHFRLTGNRIEPLTSEGRVTEFVLQLNSPAQLERRAILIPLGRYPCPTG